MQINLPDEQMLELNGLKYKILFELAGYNQHIEFKYLLPLVDRCYTMMMNNPELDISYAVRKFLIDNFLFDLLTKGDHYDIMQVLKAGMKSSVQYTYSPT
jgi:hypothetical protein